MTAARLLLLVACVACRPLPPRGPAPAVQAAALPHLVLQLDDAAPTACVVASVRAGAAFDPIGAEGAASLVAHLVAADVAVRHPELPPVRLTVGREDVTFGLACPAARAAACADALADALTGPAFGEHDVAAARAAAVAALAAVPADVLADELLDLWVFDAHPYGHPVAGRLGVLELLDPLALRRFHAAHYVRASTVVGAAGAVTLAQAHALLGRTEALGAGLTPDLPLFRALPADGRRLLVVDGGAPTVTLRVGRAFDLGPDDDVVALQLGAEALALRTGLDVTLVGLDETPGAHRRRPMLRVRLPAVAPEAAPDALRAALTSLEDAVRDGLGDAAVEAARASLVECVTARAADPCGRLASAVDAVATGRLDAGDHLAHALDRVGAEHASAALAAQLDPASLRLVAVGGGGRALADALAPLGLASVDVRPAEGVFR